MSQRRDLDEVFKALADPTRRALLDDLRRENGQTLRDLCEGIAMARQSVTQHLDLLVAANLVVVIRRGRERRHFLNPEPIHEIQRRWIHEFDRPHLDVLDVIKQRAEDSAMSQTDEFPDYVYVTYIHASAEQVWEALTNADITAIYWNGIANVSDWTPGSTWTHRIGGRDGEYDIWGQVLETKPPHRLVFTFQPAAQPLDEPGSTVAYEIEPHNNIVRLTVTHTNLPDQSTLNGISKGWPTVLANLKTYLETGIALPGDSWHLMQS
ncbi:ArsR/SmtB family transcription factor [Flexivirga meconopsidis]|uniref:ArsR/SmtB family transcription factor n=1 Tax=Flexivirga meconopsidis TaxID=2977121 RepID=UPI00223EE722